ncbi:hypothetical protein ACJBU6_00093 [Exserohilum turcicum]
MQGDSTCIASGFACDRRPPILSFSVGTGHSTSGHSGIVIATIPLSSQRPGSIVMAMQGTIVMAMQGTAVFQTAACAHAHKQHRGFASLSSGGRREWLAS